MNKIGIIGAIVLYTHRYPNLRKLSNDEKPLSFAGQHHFQILFYLLLAGDYASKDIVPLMIELYEFIRDFKDEVPGARFADCLLCNRAAFFIQKADRKFVHTNYLLCISFETSH